jgi:uncharacterized protein YybS (DUF2232 family)
MRQRVQFLLVGTLLTLLLQLFAGWLGPVGFIFNLFVALPAAYVGMRQGIVVAGGIVLLTFATLLGTTGVVAAVAYLLQFGLAAWLLVLLLRRGLAWDRAIGASMLAIAAVVGGVAGYFVLVRDLPVRATVDRYLQGETERAMDIYRQAEMSAEQLRELQEITVQIGGFLSRAWPGLAVAGTGALLLFTVYLLARMARGTYELPGLPFFQWKTPEYLVWPLIVAGAGQLLATGVLQQIALNLLLIILPIYFLQGLAIVQFYFRKRNISPLFRSLGYLLITILNPLPLVVTGMGVFDLWVDFRKPRNQQN